MPLVIAKVIGNFPPVISIGSEYAVPVVPDKPVIGAVMAAVATTGPTTFEKSVIVPALLVAVAFKRI